jgi:RNA polymerase sigma-70 factor, ECF subfamily
MSETLDNQVILEFQKGSPDAFERVFKLFYPKLVDFARRMIGNSEDAKDIVQIAFIKLFEISDKFEGTNNIQAFLYTAIKNRSLNFLRDQRTRDDKLKEIGAELLNNELLADEFEIKDALYSKVLASG